MKYVYKTFPITAETIKQDTEEYIAAIKNGNQTHIRIIAKDSNNNNINIYDEDIDMNGGITFTKCVNPQEDLTYGTVASSELIVHFLKNDKTNQIDWTKQLQFYMGVDINGTTQWLSVSYYVGSEPKTIINNGVEILLYTGYDFIIKYEEQADEVISTITFPATIKDIFDAIEAYYNNSITVVSQGSPAYTSYTINSNPFPSGCTVRDVLSWCTEMLQTMCVATDGNTNLTISDFSTSVYDVDYQLTADDYFTANISNLIAEPCAGVSIVNTNDVVNKIMYPTDFDGVPYYIVNNPIANAYSDAQKLNLCSWFNGHITQDIVQYKPMEITAVGDWISEPGDIIDIVDLNGNTIKMPIFTKTIKWNGACIQYLSCTGKPVRSELSESVKEILYNDGRYVAKSDVANDCTTEDEGYVLDARQGKVLADKIESFIYGGSLPNNTALNTVVEPGFYHLFVSQRTFTDTPPDGGTINLLLVSRPVPNGSTILQIGFGISNIYYRFRVDATTWGYWRKVSATAVT